MLGLTVGLYLCCGGLPVPHRLIIHSEVWKVQSLGSRQGFFEGTFPGEGHLAGKLGGARLLEQHTFVWLCVKNSFCNAS